MLPLAARERATVPSFVSRVGPWLLCNGSSGLWFRRSSQDCYELSAIGIWTGAKGRRRLRGECKSCSCIPQAIEELESGE